MGGDPAEDRVMLVQVRSHARRSIGAGAVMLVSIVPAMWLGALTNDTVLLAATLFAGLALVWGGRWLLNGLAMHSSASFKLRRLHARKTGLPPARLL